MHLRSINGYAKQPRQRMAASPYGGFSLIELSIVLVILGLLTGGILTGQNLIRAAELRSVSTEFQAYQTAVNTFRDKYFALPGDMRNAHQFWGSAGGSGVIGDGCEAATGTGTQTCSGNGDGIINVAAAASRYGEMFTFWQHLAAAGLITGNYDGKSGSVGFDDHNPGENSPMGRISNSGWLISFSGNYGGDPGAFAGNYQNFMEIGANVTLNFPVGPLLTPEEAWNIDTKIDDGLPALGKVMARYWNNACANGTSETDTTATYRLTDTTQRCSMIFPRVF